MENVVIKKLPQSKIQLDVTVSASEIKTAINKAAENFSKENPIAGFRPGKAPFEVVEKKCGSDKLHQKACEIAVKNNYVRVVQKEKLAVVGQPKITLKKFVPEEDLSFSAIVSIFPEIKIPNLETLNFKKPALSKIKISQEELDQAIDKLRKMRSKIVTVSRGAKEGDRVEVDFKLFMGGAPYEGGSSINYPLIIGENKFIPGFEKNLIGMKINEKNKFKLTFPKKYQDKRIEGKQGEFEVVMKLVQEIELPMLDDDFLKSAGNFKNIAQLNKKLTSNLQKEKETKEINTSLESLFTAITSSSKIDIPEILIKQEKKKMFRELEGNLSKIGLAVDKYLEQLKKTKDELFEDWNNDAKKRIRIGLALQKIAQEKKIRVKTEDIEKRAQQFMNDLETDSRKSKDLDLEKVKNYLENALLNEKTIEWLKKNILKVKINI